MPPRPTEGLFPACSDGQGRAQVAGSLGVSRALPLRGESTISAPRPPNYQTRTAAPCFLSLLFAVFHYLAQRIN